MGRAKATAPIDSDNDSDQGTEQRPTGTIRNHQCHCGWKRWWTDTEAWKREYINHPTYGRITNEFAMAQDIKRHDCQQYRNAKERLGK